MLMRLLYTEGALIPGLLFRIVPKHDCTRTYNVLTLPQPQLCTTCIVICHHQMIVGHVYVAISRPSRPFQTVPVTRKCTAVEDGSQPSYQGSNMLGYGTDYLACGRLTENSDRFKFLGKKKSAWLGQSKINLRLHALPHYV